MRTDQSQSARAKVSVLCVPPRIPPVMRTAVGGEPNDDSGGIYSDPPNNWRSRITGRYVKTPDSARDLECTLFDPKWKEASK